MTSTTNAEITYRAGTVNVPHWGITLRTLFGVAAKNHDIAKDGRRVAVTLDGVYIGEIQLMGKGLPNDQPPPFRKDPDRRGR